LFLAASFYAVSRYVNDNHVYLSTISNGRSDVKTAETYGMFVNTLPLGIEIKDVNSAEFLRQSADVFDGAIRHEKYPFARIASDYGFVPNIMYEYQIGVVSDEGGLKRKSLGLELSKFKLAIHIEERDGTPCAALYYNDALYSENLMNSLARSIVIAAENIMSEPEKSIRHVELLDDERRAVLAKYHERDYKPNIPDASLFHSGMERAAAENPNAVALIAADGRYTYKELDENANRIANALIARGVKKGSRVVLLLPRRARFFFALFGVLKAGGAYIPCDPNYPAERVRHIVGDSEAPVIITTKDRLDKDRPTVDIDELLKEPNTSRPDVSLSKEDAAYMIYTSGSTGKPKGVTIAHRGLVNYVTDTPETILPHAMVNEGKVITSVTTFSFDMAVKEFGIPLFNGLTVTVADEDQCNDAGALGRRMKETKTDLFQATPSRLLTLLESQDFREALSQCKVIICAGEKYPQHLLNKLQTEYPKARIFNTYGPTEITVSSNIRELTHDDAVTVGRPLPNVKEFIVDSDGNELPFGVVGELYIGGIGVAIGYHNLPEMTAERFIDYRGTRVYKSGDYARWKDGGNVEILGRKDNQVKLRGLRIELGEVESAVAKVEGVKSVAVKINSIKGQDHLCAYFTADRPMNIAAIRDEIGRTLTKYMVPTAWLQLDKMPMTPNGKTDLRALPEAKIERNTAEAAANDVERAFCKIFGEILQLEQVGATEDFFSLGGTSLLVTRVMIEAEKAGYRVTFQDVFSRPTPRMLAALFTDENSGSEQLTHDEIRDYDYTKLQALLDANTLESFKSGTQQPLGDILLTGATGYLGIHILHEFLENYSGKVYCLLRGKSGFTAEERLKGQLFYYFERPYDDLLGKRLFVIDGDITKPIDKLPVSTVINCAAVVKHFSAGTEIEDVNIGGVKNLIDYCLANNARLIQVSTMSTVSMGMSDSEVFKEGRMIGERDLYFNQLLHSKFLAERLVLEAVADKGFGGTVFRRRVPD
ncbi:MAG: amino acid adenylation domain-containing protein, partial [Synergistaceae bacterium]|nr:amino acid adenylation domain-containing protein [Synergistaceae bacterium]